MEISKKNKLKFQPHIENDRFYNYKGEVKPPFITPSLAMLLEWYISHKRRIKLDIENWIHKLEENFSNHEQNISVTWIGHATFLIQTGKYNILTDPVFGSLSFFFPRILPAGIELNNLPKIDYVVISHNHRDHMDTHSLTNLYKLNPEITFLVPKGDKNWFTKRKIHNVIECNWWDHISFKDLSFYFLPAYHWSQRGIFDYNKSLWGSWMITYQDQHIYFGGDTAYADHFKAIGEEFSIHTALMPIGPCEPREWMRESHISAEEAGHAFLELNAKNFIPMHWGTYYFGTDSFELPYQRFCSWWDLQLLKNSVNDKKFITLKVGQKILI